MDNKELVTRLAKRDLTDPSCLEDLFQACRLLEADEGGFELAHKWNKKVRNQAGVEIQKNATWRMLDLYKKTLLFDAQYNFDCYLQYVEWNREPNKKFYMPRRKQLYRIVQALQELADDKIDLLSISIPPGCGKTGLAIFFITWLAGKDPSKTTLGMSHTASILRGIYDECLRIMQPDGEYLWADVFQGHKVVKTNALDMRIDVDTKKRFETIEFSPIGADNAGKVRATGLLYCDDLCSGLEQSLSRERMDKLWNTYTVDSRQRKIGDPNELHIATRWSTHDVIGHLEEKYGDDKRAKFIVEPAMDENDESRFDYKYNLGYSTKVLREQREIMDQVSWQCLYLNQPIEREGLLYSKEELRRYFELPSREPDAIISVCDTKDRGTDYCSMPILYQYGNDFYVEEIICDNSNPEIVEARLISALVKHKVQASRFESNSAGGRIAEKVQAGVKERGGITKITTKYTTANKETKIILASPFVKEHFLFKDDSVIKESPEYRKALNFLCSYTMAGKNKTDDVPDSFAMAAEYIQSFEPQRVEVFRRPF